MNEQERETVETEADLEAPPQGMDLGAAQGSLLEPLLPPLDRGQAGLKEEGEGIPTPERVNLENRMRAPGGLASSLCEEYYSPEEVRTMTRSEVHHHFEAILASMPYWNTDKDR